MKKSIIDQLDKHSALKRAGAIAIVNKEGKLDGMIRIAYPKDGAGKLYVYLWDYEHEVQSGWASGYGYDKLSAALHGMKFKDIILHDHPDNWKNQIESLGYYVYILL